YPVVSRQRQVAERVNKLVPNLIRIFTCGSELIAPFLAERLRHYVFDRQLRSDEIYRFFVGKAFLDSLQDYPSLFTATHEVEGFRPNSSPNLRVSGPISPLSGEDVPDRFGNWSVYWKLFDRIEK